MPFNICVKKFSYGICVKKTFIHERRKIKILIYTLIAELNLKRFRIWIISNFSNIARDYR